MPPKRHPALQALSRDHQRFLLEARNIRWLIENDERAASLSDVVESLLNFWKEDGQKHLREEEEVLFPYYLQRAPLAKREINALITDHNWLRDTLRELADLPRYENCFPLLTSLAEYIVNHIKQEEQVIFEQIQQGLSEVELEELARNSEKFRLENRDSDARTSNLGSDIEALL